MKFSSHTATIVEEAVTPADAEAVRAKLVDWTRYTLIDRGSYEYIELADPIVHRIASRYGTVRAMRALRLVAGDYILTHHDVLPDGHGHLDDDLPFELVLDLSRAPAAADIHYRRRGAVFFRVPCAPRSLAIVERGPAVTRNHVYLSKLAPKAEVIRIVITCGA